MFWPSFNGALAADDQQQRVIVNTVLAISASCVCACGITRICKGKLDAEVVLNATLAGGVSIGSSSDLVVTGGTAMAIGGFAGIISAVGFLYLSKLLQEKIGLHDTCGVHNLHGLPGVIGAIIGAISASLADTAFENDATLKSTFEALEDGRSTSEQGWYQMAALGVSLLTSILGGAISGFICSKFSKLAELFDDKQHWLECEYDKVVEVEAVPQATDRDAGALQMKAIQ